MNYHVRLDDETVLVKNIDREKKTAEINGTAVPFDFQHVRADLYSLLVDGEAFSLQIKDAGDGREIRLGSHFFNAVIEDERQAVFNKLQSQHKTESGAALVKAPMPGLVVRLEVQKGARVEKGQGVIVIEAMKMENEIKSPISGIVSEVLVETRATVEKNTPLIRINPTSQYSRS